MTRDDRDGAAQDDAGAPAARTKPMLLAALVAGGLAIGGVAGWLAVAPRVLGTSAQAQPGASASAAGAAAADEAGGRRRSGDAGAAVSLHQLDNIVINPAETQGTRFLVTTIALETDGASAVQELTLRDVRVRDVLLRVLGARTIPELSDLAGREALKQEIADALNALLTSGRIRDVYFPQFVIQ